MDAQVVQQLSELRIRVLIGELCVPKDVHLKCVRPVLYSQLRVAHDVHLEHVCNVRVLEQ